MSLVGPLEREIESLLERPVELPEEGWAHADGHREDAEQRLRLASLSEDQRAEYLFLRVNALGDALRRIAQAIDELHAASDDGS